jgi:type IV pilus assembly protein PilW
MSLHTQRGFSLTELMLALGLSLVVVAGMYTTFVQQQQISTQQEQVTEVWQNARLAMDSMIEEIRDAGFDPGGFTRSNPDPLTRKAEIVEATGTLIHFRRDLNCNGTLADTVTPGKGVPDTSDEDIAYARRPYACPPDCPPPSQLFHISRQVYKNGLATGGYQPVADNILELNFCYFLQGDLESDPPKDCTSNPLTLPGIRAVQITVTAKATAPDSHYTDQDPNNNKLYKNYTHYRKATITSLVRLRNLGVDRGNKTFDLDPQCNVPPQNPPPNCCWAKP